MVNLDQLRYIVAAVRLGSYSEAAKSLYVSHQTISKAVGDYERRTGVSLMVREGRGVRPTKLAILIVERAERLLREVEDLEAFSRIFQLNSLEKGKICLGLSLNQFRGSLIPMEVIRAFSIAHPRICLEVLPLTSDSCLEALRQDLVDAAIILGRHEGAGYRCVRIGSMTLRAVVAERCSLAKLDEVTLEDLSSLVVAYPRDMHCLLSTIMARCRALGIGTPTFVPLESSEQAHRSFLGNGGVVLSAPESSLLSSAVDTGKIIEVPFSSNGLPPFPICLVAKDAGQDCLRRLESFLFEHL